MTLAENVFENLRLELRRGCLTLAVLAQLREERYGYTLRKALADDGLVIDESTSTPCCAALKPRACWPASGAKKRSETSASTASPRRRTNLRAALRGVAGHQRGHQCDRHCVRHRLHENHRRQL